MDVLVAVLGVVAGTALAVAVVGWQRATGQDRVRSITRALAGLVGG